MSEIGEQWSPNTAPLNTAATTSPAADALVTHALPGCLLLLLPVLEAGTHVELSALLPHLSIGQVEVLLLPDALALFGMAVLFIGLAFRKITKRLEG